MSRERKPINIEVGERIRDRRTELNLTRDELANQIRYSTNFIKEVEHGRSGLSSESIRAFSKALNISCDSLLFGTPSDKISIITQTLLQVPEERLDYIGKIINDLVDYTK